MITLGSGGGDGGNTLAALLEVVSKPDEAKARLQELVTQAKQAEDLLAQARAVQAQNEQLAIEITNRTEDSLKTIAAKEADLAAREQALANRLAEVDAYEKQLAALKTEIDETKERRMRKYTAAKDALQQQEAAKKEALAKQEEELAARMAEIEAAHQASKADLQKRAEALAATQAAADAKLAEAAKLKESYEEKVAALKKLVG